MRNRFGKLLAWLGVLIGMPPACGPSESDYPVPQYGQFPLPTELGISIQEVRKAAAANLPGYEALDEEDRWVKGGPQWRSHFYTLFPETPGLGVNVIYRYRVEDDKVWSISVANAAGRYAGSLGAVDFNTKIADVEASLGSPTLRQATSPIEDQYVWKRQDEQLVVAAYSTTYDDITEFARKGQIRFVLKYSTTLGPPGFVGYEEASKN